MIRAPCWCTGCAQLVRAAANGQERLSSYAESLSAEAKIRYQEKILVINGVDPLTGCFGEAVETVPRVDASDLVSYLILQTNFITAK